MSNPNATNKVAVDPNHTADYGVEIRYIRKGVTETEYYSEDKIEQIQAAVFRIPLSSVKWVNTNPTRDPSELLAHAINWFKLGKTLSTPQDDRNYFIPTKDRNADGCRIQEKQLLYVDIPSIVHGNFIPDKGKTAITTADLELYLSVKRRLDEYTPVNTFELQRYLGVKRTIDAANSTPSSGCTNPA